MFAGVTWSIVITVVYLTLLVAIANHQSLLALRWTPVAQAALTLALERADQDHSRERTAANTDERNASFAGQAVLDVGTSWFAPRPWLRACRPTMAARLPADFGRLEHAESAIQRGIGDTDHG
jgi:hypothetical protein